MSTKQPPRPKLTLRKSNPNPITFLPVQVQSEPASVTVPPPTYEIYSIYPGTNRGKQNGAIFLSDYIAAANIPTLLRNQIKRVVNLCYGLRECQYVQSPDIKYLTIDLSDTIAVADTEMPSVICQTYPFIQEGLQLGENVLVHCQAGISRSVTIIMAYLILSESEWIDNLPINEKSKLDKLLQPNVGPNLGFMLLLDQLERDWNSWLTTNCPDLVVS